MLSYGCTLYGVNVSTVGMSLLASVIICLYSVWRQRKYIWRGLPLGGYHMTVLCTVSASVPLAWVSFRRLENGCTLHGVLIATFGLGLLVLVIIWLYSVWRQRTYLWLVSLAVGYHMAVLCMASA